MPRPAPLQEFLQQSSVSSKEPFSSTLKKALPSPAARLSSGRPPPQSSAPRRVIRSSADLLLPQHPVTLRAGSSVFKAGFVTAGGKWGCWSQACPSVDSYKTPAVRVSGTHRGQLVSREQPGEGFHLPAALPAAGLRQALGRTVSLSPLAGLSSAALGK